MMIYNEHVQHIRSSKEYCGLSSNIQNKENATGTVHYTTKKKNTLLKRINGWGVGVGEEKSLRVNLSGEQSTDTKPR